MARTGEINESGKICFVQKDGFVNWLTPKAYQMVIDVGYQNASFAVANGERLHPGIQALFQTIGETLELLTLEEKERLLGIQNRTGASLETALVTIFNEREQNPLSDK